VFGFFFITTVISLIMGRISIVLYYSIETAKKCDAGVVKLQVHTQDTLTIDCGNKYFK